MAVKFVDGWAGGGVVKGSQATVDLPVKNGTPVAINVSLKAVAVVNISASAAFYWCDADSVADALIAIASDASRQLVHAAGSYTFNVATIDTALYFTETGGAGVVTDGLSYHLIEG